MLRYVGRIPERGGTLQAIIDYIREISPESQAAR